jgi:serine/threonine protein kinase
MQPERWQQVSQIFEAALALPAEERPAFVAAQCGPDLSLRSEVESLIASHEKASADSFISGHAAERAAPLLPADEEQSESSRYRLRPGQRVGNYEVKELLGVGGMGEVYRAIDSRLDRTVALKILPAEVATDQRRMLRFKQEARVVSGLNQPNILTIYEFGEDQELHFLASEYIDGDTLRRELVRGQLTLPQILEIAIQICAALDAAHEANIVHRDIKPENVMIRRRDRVVKVLDFGLAKLADKKSNLGQSTDTEAATEVLLKTMPGSIMGTFNYMSPEQAQGLHVDHRSDIWSVGVVIYEMVAGRSPFTGPTNSHTVVSILERDPESLTRTAKIGVPAELERIVSKSLAKDPDERYQTAKDLLVDLKNLRKQLEHESQMRRNRDSQTADRTHVTGPLRVAKARSLWPFLALLAVVIAGVAIFRSVWRGTHSAPAANTTAVAEHKLNYWITVQKYRNGEPFERPFNMAKEINFEKDYRIRLNVKSPEAGYLYVLNESPDQGEPLSILFPSPTTNQGSAFLAENTVITIPDASWFRLDSERGREKVWLIWSANTVAELEALRRFANPTDRGVITDANLNQEALKFIQKPNATAQRNETVEQTTILSTKPSIVHLITLEHH